MTQLYSQFDIEALKIGEQGDQRSTYVEMAQTAESCERYEDMCQFMKKLVFYCETDKSTLTVEERNLLSVAYKNVIGARRASYRCMVGEIEACDTESKTALLVKYKEKLEEEVTQTCNELLSLLEENLIPGVDNSQEGDKDGKSGSDEASVFYLKMTGDYYRYQSELSSSPGEAPGPSSQKAAEYYGKAYDIAKEKMASTNPIRLGLALNYSVCFYEILNDKDKACNMAKNAFDEAIAKLDQLDESDYKDSTLIMQLLRDNLTLWTSDTAENQNDED